MDGGGCTWIVCTLPSGGMRGVASKDSSAEVRVFCVTHSLAVDAIECMVDLATLGNVPALVDP